MYWNNRVVPQTEKFNETQPITRLTNGAVDGSRTATFLAMWRVYLATPVNSV